MPPGCYRVIFYFQLHKAVGTRVRVVCSGAADQFPDPTQPVYPTQPESTRYLSLPIDLVVTRPDPKLWIVVQYDREPEPRRISAEIDNDAHIRFGGVTIHRKADDLQVSVGEFMPTEFEKCWPQGAHVFLDGTTTLLSDWMPGSGFKDWQTSADRKEWRALTMSLPPIISFLDRPGKGIMALSWYNKGDDPADLSGTLYRAESGQAWADGKITAAPYSYSVPQAVVGVSEGRTGRAGGVIEKSIVELSDGSLLASAYGKLQGQNDLVDPNNPEGDTRCSTWFVRSADDGKSWVFHGQVPYHKTMGGREGFDEPTVVRFPDTGELLCMMRTGYGVPQCPLHQSRSFDDGKTWTFPQAAVGALRGDFNSPGTMLGVFPSLVLMENGVLVCSWGRTPPGVHLAFSVDRGHTWQQPVTLGTKSMSSYVRIWEIRPGVLLALYDNDEVLGFQEITVEFKTPR